MRACLFVSVCVHRCVRLVNKQGSLDDVFELVPSVKKEENGGSRSAKVTARGTGCGVRLLRCEGEQFFLGLSPCRCGDFLALAGSAAHLGWALAVVVAAVVVGIALLQNGASALLLQLVGRMRPSLSRTRSAIQAFAKRTVNSAAAPCRLLRLLLPSRAAVLRGERVADLALKYALEERF